MFGLVANIFVFGQNILLASEMLNFKHIYKWINNMDANMKPHVFL